MHKGICKGCGFFPFLFFLVLFLTINSSLLTQEHSNTSFINNKLLWNLLIVLISFNVFIGSYFKEDTAKSIPCISVSHLWLIMSYGILKKQHNTAKKMWVKQNYSRPLHFYQCCLYYQIWRRLRLLIKKHRRDNIEYSVVWSQ